ncbi:hypothetical protein [Oryza sativa Japonica Group]|uniref:Uncharacterized protein n=1 Tax=Oryza sativa subsp. japonica TaxID=39947 RepID=Q5QM66_ORYSJ|nr:hypothetical protein [Oryza sativa Japonica Group]BAD73492.1 hypothetical protein [Oryza sativa Japonica Group]
MTAPRRPSFLGVVATIAAWYETKHSQRLPVFTVKRKDARPRPHRTHRLAASQAPHVQYQKRRTVRRFQSSTGPPSMPNALHERARARGIGSGGTYIAFSSVNFTWPAKPRLLCSLGRGYAYSSIFVQAPAPSLLDLLAVIEEAEL